MGCGPQSHLGPISASRTKNIRSVPKRKVSSSNRDPKFLFVARHIWPTKQILDQLDVAIHNFIWTGSLTIKRTAPSKATLRRELSQLPVHKRGVGAPNIKQELLAMAANTVEAWAATNSGLAHDLGAAFVNIAITKSTSNGGQPTKPKIQVTWQPQRKPTWASCMWTAGVGMLAQVYGRTKHKDITEGIQATAAKLASARRHDTWQNGWWTPVTETATVELKTLCQLQAEIHGHCVIRWLPMLAFCGQGAIMTTKGTELKRSDFGNISNNKSLVGEIATWKILEGGRIAFNCSTASYPMSTKTANQFKTFCELLIANYPEKKNCCTTDTTLTQLEHTRIEMRHGR